jgi:hypothetical protein
MTDAVKLGKALQKISKEGFDAAVRSYGEWNKGLRALATRTTMAFEDTTPGSNSSVRSPWSR